MRIRPRGSTHTARHLDHAKRRGYPSKGAAGVNSAFDSEEDLRASSQAIHTIQKQQSDDRCPDLQNVMVVEKIVTVCVVRGASLTAFEPSNPKPELLRPATPKTVPSLIATENLVPHRWGSPKKQKS